VSVNAQDHIVFVVDDDRRIRESLCELLAAFNLNAVALGSAAEYIAHPRPDMPACLVLDVELPDISEQDLLRAISAAIAQDRETRRKKAELADLRQRLDALSPRERDVLPLVVSGLLNKQSAAALGISEVTLQIHRSNVMKKMGASSLADLVRIALALEIPIGRRRQAKL
jgi:FixJ family two-component response regulator